MSTDCIDGMVVGIFKEETRAEDAIDELKSIGFNDDQISFATQEGSREMHRIRDILERMGVPEEELNYYTSEFEVGRSILLVKHGGRRIEALNVLYLNGTRSHKYLNFDRHTGWNSNDILASAGRGLNDQIGTSQNSSSNNWSNIFSKRDAEVTEQDDLDSLHKLLKGAGLDHLL